MNFVGTINHLNGYDSSRKKSDESDNLHTELLYLIVGYIRSTNKHMIRGTTEIVDLPKLLKLHTYCEKRPGVK